MPGWERGARHRDSGPHRHIHSESSVCQYLNLGSSKYLNLEPNVVGPEIGCRVLDCCCNAP
jgi:hypothetical protein